MFKKFILVLISIISLSSFMFAQNKDEVLIEISVESDNISDSVARSLIPSIAEKLEANLTKYTDFTILNTVNQKAIFAIQAKTESDAYEKKIQDSKFKAPTHELFTIVRSLGSDGYTLSIRFTDLVTGSSKTFVSPIKSDKIDLYASNGCAVDEITIQICEQFGVPLDPIQQVSIMKGDAELTNDEMTSLYDEEIENYKKRIAQAEKEIEVSKVSSDVNASIAEAKYRSDKALAEEKLRIAEENKKKLLIEDEKKKEQEMLDATRTSEQQNRIASMESAVHNKMKEVRTLKYENESVIGQINIIESRKKAVIDIFKTLEKEENEIINNVKKDIAIKQDQILNAPPKSIETMKDKKTLTEKAILNRKRRFRQTRGEIVKDAKNNLSQLGNTLAAARDDLLYQIGFDSYNFKSRFVDTLGSDLLVTFSTYDGVRGGWDLAVTVKCDGVTLFTTKSFLPFETLTGKNPETYFDEDFDNYSYDVDYYDSLFLRGSKILTFSLQYDVKAMDIDHPSQYSFTFSNFRFNDTNTLSVVDNKFVSELSGELSLDNTKTVRKMKTVYNMKPYESLMRSFSGNSTDISLRSTYASNTYIPIMHTFYYPKVVYDGEGDNIILGNIPKGKKNDSVKIDLDKQRVINGFNCFKGSDNYYYTPVSDRYNNITYYKMQPSYWKRLDKAYVDGDGKNQENFYINSMAVAAIPYYLPKQNYSGYERTANNRGNIQDASYEFSTVRAYLNNLNGESYNVLDFTEKGLLTSLFPPTAINLINDTCVKNGNASSYIDSWESFDAIDFPTGVMKLPKEQKKNTYDKLFLLSREEMGKYFEQCGPEYSNEAHWRRDKRFLASAFAAWAMGCPYAKEEDTSREYNSGTGSYETYSLYNKGAAAWILRTPFDKGTIYAVDTDLRFYSIYSYTESNMGVVPCFTITNKNLGL